MNLPLEEVLPDRPANVFFLREKGWRTPVDTLLSEFRHFRVILLSLLTPLPAYTHKRKWLNYSELTFISQVRGSFLSSLTIQIKQVLISLR